ncbi:radical SAM protein [Melioribacteraceae bacterium 4301-Me]|uniref:radical SAM protein n=1 Tax=Pyranulibacter aquaticus TaxID=3163344 RepID=UPI00359BFEE0
MELGIINSTDLYRLPWTLPDNGISWLEPTARCNLNCYGCYRKNIKDSHKSMEQVKHELDVFQSLRKTDCISIAGGEPLLYPNIVELVAEIKSRGLKPIINSNGIALTKELLHELKEAGVFGFTFHIDSKQGRGRGPQWEGKNELELNELRLYYAEMLAAEGGIACSFNSTVYGDTLQYVPELVNWAQKHIDIVHTMVFILFRYITPDLPYDFYAGDKKIEFDEIHYHSNKEEITNLMSPQIVAEIRKKFPEFSPAAFLNGTHKADDFKWLLTERIGTKDKIFGYLNNKFIEMVMEFYHYRNDRYLSYASPKTLSLGRATLFNLWGINKSVRKALKKYLGYLAVNPFRIFKKVYMQSIMIIQPVDFMPNGDQSMCDGCPDITVWKDRNGKDQLVWSCRLEEPMQYGVFLKTVPKN